VDIQTHEPVSRSRVLCRDPHIIGVPPRSRFAHDEEERAIAIALEGCRGRIHPTYVVANQRVIGISQGRGPFSPDARFTRLRPTYRSKWKDNEQIKSDMLFMPWADQNAMISDITNGKYGRTYWAKTPTTAGVANRWYDLWPVAGNPAAGSVAGTAKTAVAWTDASTGSMNHRGNVSTDTKHMLWKRAVATANTPMFMLYDRVISYDQNPYAAAVNQTMTNTATAGRYNTAAPGLLILMCVCTVNGATATNITQLRYCADTTTECMTKRLGWTHHDDLLPTDEILAWDPVTQTSKWETPKEVYLDRHYKGDMTLLGRDGERQEFNALVTDDHRWPIRQRTRNGTLGEIAIKRTHELGQEGFIIRSAPYAEAPKAAKYSDAFVRLVGWYVTEGSLNGKAHVTITQSLSHNPQHVASIRRDLAEIGALASPENINDGRQRDENGRLAGPRDGLFLNEGFDKRSDCVSFQLSGSRTVELLACAPGPDKIPTMDFLLALTDDQLQVFVDTMQAGDGTPSKRHFYQHLRARMDMYSVAATLAGHSPSISRDGTTCSLSEHRQMERGAREITTGLGKLSRTTLYYEGPIWCPVTESGHWIARRGGKVFVTGNTNQVGTTLQSMPTTPTVSIVVSGAAPTATLGAIVIAPSSAATPTWGAFMPLATGDSGCRLVNDYTPSAANTGTFTIVLMHPLTDLIIPLAAVPSDADCVYQLTELEQIFDGACIALASYQVATTAHTASGSFGFGW
jgi:hypothetical protein